MHEIAELGLAAHWAYKQDLESSLTGVQFRWVRELLEILENASSPEEFMENTKLEMYYDQVFCFSPKGDLIALPKGSTPIDFAFAVHSDIGLTCIGARVNGRIVPLKTVLENGDQVEILRAKNPMPSPGWEKFVVTGKARAEIRKFVRSQQRDEYVSLGKAIMSKTFEQEGKELKEPLLEAVLALFKRNTLEDLYCSIGEGVINRIDVYRAIYPLEKSKRKSLNPLSLFNLVSKKDRQEKQKQSLPIKGLIPGMAVHFAGCCHPLPGDRIVGIVNTGRGITIHTIDCELLDGLSNSPERWIDVSWEGGEDEKYVGRIKIIISNETGSLASITSCIASSEANIVNLKIIGRSLDFFEIIIDLDVKSTQGLISVMSALRALNCVHSVDRSNAN
jgi:GTP pyrophosphokinase